MAWVVAAVVATAVVGFLWLGSSGHEPVALLDPEPTFPTPAPESPSLTVYVSGEVAGPGLVVVGDGARVADAIAAAGGALRTADLSVVNLAAPIGDAAHVHVPAAHGTAPDGRDGEPPGVAVNRASVRELEELPGVGPVLAQRIADHRSDLGPFATVEDLLDVPGIGEAKLAQLRDAVVLP